MEGTCVDPRVTRPPYVTLVTERVIDAPRDRVWRAWTDPEELKRWWGPLPFTAPVMRLDAREGGAFLFDMRSPDGRDNWRAGRVCELVPEERLVMSVRFSDERGEAVPPARYRHSADFPEEMRWVVTLEDAGRGRTRLVVRHDGFPNEREREEASMGWGSQLDKLEQALRDGYAELPMIPW